MDALGSEILERAQDDAASLFGRQRYAVYAYYAARPEAVAESKVFTRDGGGAEGEEGEEVDSEGPTFRGVMTQFMRHNETNFRTAVLASNHAIKSLSDQNKMYADRLLAIEGRHMEVVAAYEGILSERHIREQATRESEFKMRLYGEAFDKLRVLVPVVVNKFAGAPIMPASTTAEKEMLRSFALSLKPEQLKDLSTVLTPEQMIVVLDIWNESQQHAAKMDAERAEADRAMRAGASAGAASAAAAPGGA